MNVVIVNCFDPYEDRVDLLYNFFRYKGYNVKVIQSNFRHIKKVKRTDDKKDFIFVDSKPYYKNLSIARMDSHYTFAKKAFKVVEKLNPDLLYVIVPPNSLVKFASEYKNKNINVKLIFDLMDLWPETMPVGKIKTLPPFYIWRMLRDNGLSSADYIITECDLYEKVLEKQLKGLKTKSLYLAKKESDSKECARLNKDRIELCYLGSINNIINIMQIKEVIDSLNKRKPTTLNIIGEGEKREEFIREIKSTGAEVKYHGIIYDYKMKQDIFDKCHFGLNMMKDTVCVGLTMKSIDYFQSGLPIINNIKADTEKFVNKYNVGINLYEENIEEVATKICELEMVDFISMRKNSKYIFDSFFSIKAFNRQLEEIIRELE